jgi:hypothetical protein
MSVQTTLLRPLAPWCLLLLAAGLAPAQTITATGFSAASWGASDATLGITGYAIEDFEDTTLVSGLLVGWETEAGNTTPATTLPFTFNPATDDPFGDAFETLGGGGVWDGSRTLINTRTNQSYNYSALTNWGDIVLTFTNPATSVGFSLQQNEYQVVLYINGTNMGTLQSLTGLVPDGNRYGYIRIDGTLGTQITSLRLANTRISFYDGFVIDHVAFAAVPEPAASALGLALGAVVLVLWQRRRRT